MLPLSLLAVLLGLLAHATATPAPLLFSASLPHASVHPSHAAAPQPLNGTYTVDISRPIHALSVDMWGVFYEEIGYSGQGGIHQEQVFNGNFETFTADYAPWETLLTAGGGGDVEYVVSLSQDYPINAFNPTSMVVETRMSGSSGSGGSVKVGMVNPGYWGISLVGRRMFNFSTFVMSPSITALTIRLQSNTSMGAPHTYAEATVPVTSTWSKQTVMLMLNASSTDDSAVLTLTWTTQSPSTTLYLDVISLQPATGFDAVPWLRPDLGALVAELRPSVVRLPGGCYVEGGRLSNRFNWKRAMGPQEERRGHLNDVWGYYVEDHLGIFEYLSWVESLRDVYNQPSRTVWVVNSGTAHSDSIPTSHISGWVQDALDSIEFIRGNSSTDWGRRRAEMGREAPFGSLKYVAIGNEDCGKPYYESNYRVFYDALQAAHPDLILIGNCEPSQMNATEQVWDYHVYPSYDWFLGNEAQWDKYPRDGPLVYVSEYATHGGQGKGNLRAALAEAVYMLGMERNADLITMAAYAPLYTNVEGRPDNIQQAVKFNHRAAYGTPSYWTQWMFARAIDTASSNSVHTISQSLSASLHKSNFSAGALLGSIPSGVDGDAAAQQQLVVLKLVNYHLAAPVQLTIQLTGLSQSDVVQPAVEVRTLTAASELAENSFDDPLHVSVDVSTLAMGAPSFQYSVPPNSFTVMRLVVVSGSEAVQSE